jgi:PAS domain S-box-containing protein
VVRDVTAQQEAQRELLEKQELYQHLFDANPQPLWVYDTETLHIVAVNDAALHQYGYSREEFLNLAMSDLYLAGDQSRATTANTAFNPDGAWQHSKRDGSVFYAEVTSHELSFNGRCARLVLAHDVTERIETEAALQAAEAKYRSIFENAIEGIFQTTPAGIYLTANSMLARLYGYNSPDELTNSVTDIGQQIYVEPGRRDEFARRMQQDGYVENFESPFAAAMDKSSGFPKMHAPCATRAGLSSVMKAQPSTSRRASRPKPSDATPKKRCARARIACATSWSIRATCSTRSRRSHAHLCQPAVAPLLWLRAGRSRSTHAGPTF